MNIFRNFFLYASFIALFPCNASAAVGAKVSFSDLDSKPHVSGTKYKAGDLKGKVVFFEYWGINCPPCLAAMPHLQALHSKYASKGLVVIGSHSQMPSPRVQEYLKANKITFPIYQFASLAEAPCPGGLPYSVLIGANGKVVAEGQPSTLYGKVEEEVAKAANGQPILGDLELKKYKSLSKSLTTKSSNVEAKITALRDKADDEEAQAICQAYDEWLEQEKSRVQNLCDTNPLQAAKAIRRLKTIAPSVTDFDQQLSSIKNNAGLQKLADTGKKLEAMRRTLEKGRRVSPSAVKKLKETVQAAQSSSNEQVKAAAGILLGEVEDLASQVETSSKN